MQIRFNRRCFLPNGGGSVKARCVCRPFSRMADTAAEIPDILERPVGWGISDLTLETGFLIIFFGAGPWFGAESVSARCGPNVASEGGKVKKTFCVIAAAMVMVSVAWAGTGPMEALRGPIEEGIALLRNPQYAEADKKDQQRDEMWKIIRQAFDFRLIAARALGRNWSRFSTDQKEEFTEAFATLLGNTYIGKIQGEFNDERVDFLQEEMVSDNKAVIHTRIVRKNAEIPVDYNMILRDGQWRIYDVKVEGIGLVLNYRKQFKSFLAKETGTPASLIESLREKTGP